MSRLLSIGGLELLPPIVYAAGRRPERVTTLSHEVVMALRDVRIAIPRWAVALTPRRPRVTGRSNVVRDLATLLALSILVPGMSRAQDAAPPEKVNDDGVPLNGAGPVGFSAAVLPYLQSIPNETAVAQQLVRVKSQLDEKSNLYGAGYGSGPTYYDQNLVLFASGWMEKRFQFGASGELLVRWSR